MNKKTGRVHVAAGDRQPPPHDEVEDVEDEEVCEDYEVVVMDEGRSRSFWKRKQMDLTVGVLKTMLITRTRR